MITVTATTTDTTTATCAATSAATSTVVVAHEAAADADVRQVDDVDSEFFALIYSDPELLRDEFEQLVAAAWSGRPPPTAAPGRGSEHPPDRPTVVRAFAGGGRPAGPVARRPRSRCSDSIAPEEHDQIVVTRPVTTERRIPTPGDPYSAGWLPCIRPLIRAPDTLIHTVIHTVRRPCGERTSGQP